MSSVNLLKMLTRNRTLPLIFGVKVKLLYPVLTLTPLLLASVSSLTPLHADFSSTRARKTSANSVKDSVFNDLQRSVVAQFAVWRQVVMTDSDADIASSLSPQKSKISQNDKYRMNNLWSKDVICFLRIVLRFLGCVDTRVRNGCFVLIFL